MIRRLLCLLFGHRWEKPWVRLEVSGYLIHHMALGRPEDWAVAGALFPVECQRCKAPTIRFSRYDNRGYRERLQQGGVL